MRDPQEADPYSRQDRKAPGLEGDGAGLQWGWEEGRSVRMTERFWRQMVVIAA